MIHPDVSWNIPYLWFLPVAWATARCPLWVSTLPDAGRTWRSPWPSSNSWSDDICWPSNKLRWKPLDKNIGKNIGRYRTYWKTFRKTIETCWEKWQNVGTLSYRKRSTHGGFSLYLCWISGRWIFGWTVGFDGRKCSLDRRWYDLSHGSRSKLSRKNDLIN